MRFPTPLLLLLPLLAVFQWSADAAVLWAGDGIVTHPGGMSNGSDRSAISPGANLFGFSAKQPGFRLAEDFTVAAGGQWQPEKVRFFAYQTGSSLASTITGVTLVVWRDAVGSGTMVWGNSATNVLAGTGFTGSYRTSGVVITDFTRPIMYAEVNLAGLTLDSGTYWLDWSFTGSLASGPWQPPASNPNAAVAGNALHFSDGAWEPAMDGNGTVQAAFPFEILGLVPEADTVVLAALAAGCPLLRRRRERAGSAARIHAIHHP